MSSGSASTNDEVIVQGVPVSPGKVLGRGFVYKKRRPEIASTNVNEQGVPAQLRLLEHAREGLRKQWNTHLQDNANAEFKEVLRAQLAIIDDPNLANEIERLIEDHHLSAQKAIQKAFASYITKFTAADNPLLQERTIDLEDIRDQLIERAGQQGGPEFVADGEILVAREISPREVIECARSGIKGIILEQGGTTSHASIIARSVGIPAVVGASGILQKMTSAAPVLLNGDQGQIALHPSAESRQHFEEQNATAERSLEARDRICNHPSKTEDGQVFTIRANIEFSEELQSIQTYRANGVGLLRTESQYLSKQHLGSAKEQARFYTTILEETGSAPITIRLFDVGGDKFQDDTVFEPNPFLGWRGIRMLLDERTILRKQLKAILTASGKYKGRVKLLIPMVSTLHEIAEVKKELRRCRTELHDNNIETDPDIALGIMVEIPTVAIQAEHFAPEVDFFSIGTNDLTQYLLAVDRGNALISTLYDQQHPAIWRVIHHVIEVGSEHGVDVAICGELASYPVAASCLLGMGLTEFSMSPVSIPRVKQQLINRSHGDMQQLAENVLQCESTEEVKSLFTEWVN